jgi:hypothetical protein
MATAPVSSRADLDHSPARFRSDSPSTSVTSATSGGGGASSDRTKCSSSPSGTCWSATVRATSNCSPVERTRIRGRATELIGSSRSSMSRGNRPLTASSFGTTRSALRADPITVSRVKSVIGPSLLVARASRSEPAYFVVVRRGRTPRLPLQERTYTFVPDPMHTLQRV